MHDISIIEEANITWLDAGDVERSHGLMLVCKYYFQHLSTSALVVIVLLSQTLDHAQKGTPYT
eukprot:GSA25T00017000001.1